ncbi:MAG: 4-hydroxy-tetrahydrodipicolinate reductase [Deltaproteobacteria bacterium]|nr:4-hydroxy-tetrahydrodipicolinate reductase [Deltaproteobacteria bacterium]
MSAPASGARVAVLGANGRMGRAVVRLAHAAGMKVVAAVGSGDEGRDAGELAGIGALGVAVTSGIAALASSGAEVVIDFSAPAPLAVAAKACAAKGVALVSGTTGLDDAAKAALDEAARGCAIMWEPNMSVGVHVLATLVEKAMAALGPSFDVEVVEVHHRQKADAPSGTAIRLGDVVKNARGARYEHGREGRPGPRKADEIGMHAVRGGDVIGDHTVYFFGDGERIELTHRASSRDLFAHGSVRAAAWIAGKKPGRYRLADVIGG